MQGKLDVLREGKVEICKNEGTGLCRGLILTVIQS